MVGLNAVTTSAGMKGRVEMKTSRAIFTLAVVAAIAGGVYYWMQGTVPLEGSGGRQRMGGGPCRSSPRTRASPTYPSISKA